MRSKNEIRTRNYNVRVGDKTWVDGSPALFVKGGGNKMDIYTVKELLTAFYGEKWKYITIEQNGEIIVIE